MNPPPLSVRLLGNLPAFVLVMLASVAVFMLSLTFQQPPIGAAVALFVALGELRLRARLTEYNVFAANWRRVGGNAAPPRRIPLATSLFWVAFIAGGGSIVLGTVRYAIRSGGQPDMPLNPDETLTVLSGLGLLLYCAGSLVYQFAVRPLRNARARKAAAGKQVDGKELPGSFVTVALGVPRSSPNAAAITRSLPSYCLPLLADRARKVAAGSASEPDEDAMVQMPAAKSIWSWRGFAQQLHHFTVRKALVWAGGTMAALLVPFGAVNLLTGAFTKTDEPAQEIVRSNPLPEPQAPKVASVPPAPALRAEPATKQRIRPQAQPVERAPAEQHDKPLQERARAEVSEIAELEAACAEAELYRKAASSKGRTPERLTDVLAATRLYEKGVKADYAPALYGLGSLYVDTALALEGFSTPGGDKTALRSITRAAQQGYAPAQKGMGYVYQYGLLGVQTDFSMAASWFLKAAKQGDTDAMKAWAAVQKKS